MLKGQDIILLILLRLRPDAEWNYDALAGATGLSRSQCHLAVKRLQDARLLLPKSVASESPWKVSIAHFNEYVIHGLKYHFPGRIGPVVRGIATAHSAPFVAEQFAQSPDAQGMEHALVWPSPEGDRKGNGLAPIHPCQLRFAPDVKSDAAERRDEKRDIYEMLVCIDLLRLGRAREQEWAAQRIQAAGHGD